MKTSVQMQFVFADSKQSEAALAALRHEEEFKKRCESKVIRNANKLMITIASDDVASLRASLNAYLRDIQIAEGVEKAIANTTEGNV